MATSRCIDANLDSYRRWSSCWRSMSSFMGRRLRAVSVAIHAPMKGSLIGWIVSKRS